MPINLSSSRKRRRLLDFPYQVASHPPQISIFFFGKHSPQKAKEAGPCLFYPIFMSALTASQSYKDIWVPTYISSPLRDLNVSLKSDLLWYSAKISKPDATV